LENKMIAKKSDFEMGYDTGFEVGKKKGKEIMKFCWEETVEWIGRCSEEGIFSDEFTFELLTHPEKALEVMAEADAETDRQIDRMKEEEDEETLCGKPHNNGDNRPEVYNECMAIKHNL